LYQRRLSRKSAFVAGTEVYADYSLQKSLEAQGLTYDYHKVGLLLGHDLLIGKFSIGTYLGGYLYSPAPLLTGCISVGKSVIRLVAGKHN